MIRAALNDADVRAKLLAMSERSRKRAYQVALRRAAAPVVKDLQRGWARAKRRTGLVTGEIADGQQARITFSRRKASSGMATLQIGANYRLGGYVKLWHILENGFRHFSRSSAYKTLGAEVQSLQRKRREFFKAQVAAAGGRPKNRDARASLMRGISASWKARAPQADAKIAAAHSARLGRREEARRSGSRMIAGFRVSRRIAQQHVSTLAAKAQQYLVAEVMAPLRRRVA